MGRAMTLPPSATAWAGASAAGFVSAGSVSLWSATGQNVTR